MLYDIEGIFTSLHDAIQNSPQNLDKHIIKAKESVLNMINSRNYEFFSDILEKIKPIDIKD